MEDLIRFGKCLSDPGVVRVLALLREGELCICELMAALEGTPSKLDRVLRKLREVEMVKTGRHGHWLSYRLSPRVTDLVETVFETFDHTAEWDAQLTKDHDRLMKCISRRVDGWCPTTSTPLVVR